MPALVCVVLLTSTVPTVAPVSPFTPGDRRDGRRVRAAVIRHGVRRDHDRRVGLVDRVGDRRAGDVVVVRGPREAPGVARIRAGIRVSRVAHVHRADGRPRLAVHAIDRRVRRRVGPPS